MFRHIFSSYSKFAFGYSVKKKAAICLFSSVAVAVSNPGNVTQSWSDSELKKKPGWYQENVHRLEYVIKKLRVENVNNCEISWRLGRVFVEQANLHPNMEIKERKELLEKAIVNLNKALQLETSQGSAGAHKWYAIALFRLKQVDKNNKFLKNADKEIIKHFETSVKLDPKDAFSHHFLGVQYFFVGNNEAALKNLKKAEDLKPGYSANQAYLGMALAMNNKKDEAIVIMKKALQGTSKNKADRKAKVVARAFLQNKLGQTSKDLQFAEEY